MVPTFLIKTTRIINMLGDPKGYDW